MHLYKVVLLFSFRVIILWSSANCSKTQPRTAWMGDPPAFLRMQLVVRGHKPLGAHEAGHGPVRPPVPVPSDDDWDAGQLALHGVLLDERQQLGALPQPHEAGVGVKGGHT